MIMVFAFALEILNYVFIKDSIVNDPEWNI